LIAIILPALLPEETISLVTMHARAAEGVGWGDVSEGPVP
jgi:hypothetical protein